MVINKPSLLTRQKKRNLITFTFPDSKISEQFRTIRANVHFVTSERKNPIFLITSPNSGEGKSTTAANLAVSMAYQKEKVLLIDTNLRQPSAQFIFKIQSSVGLTDVLTGKTTFEEAIYRTEIGRLEVLTSGPVPFNPAELLGSYPMQELLKKAAQCYDVVLIDSPSVLEVTDTKLLAGQCDGVLLVLNQGKTQIEEAAEAKKELEFAKAKVTGVILNKF